MFIINIYFFFIEHILFFLSNIFHKFFLRTFLLFQSSTFFNCSFCKKLYQSFEFFKTFLCINSRLLYAFPMQIFQHITFNDKKGLNAMEYRICFGSLSFVGKCWNNLYAYNIKYHFYFKLYDTNNVFYHLQAKTLLRLFQHHS